MTEEKFISIDFYTWETKYKPMEAELDAAKRDLKREQESKTVSVWLKTPIVFMGGGYSTGDREIKMLYVDLDTKKLSSTSIIDADIADEVRSHFFTVLATYSQTHDINSVGEVNEVINKYYAAKLDAEQAIDKVKSLPRIFRWLFGIKTIDLKQQSPQ